MRFLLFSRGYVQDLDNKPATRLAMMAIIGMFFPLHVRGLYKAQRVTLPTSVSC